MGVEAGVTRVRGINPGLIAAATFLAAAIFLVDLSLSLVPAKEVLWMALVLLGWWFPRRSYVFLLAVVSSVLTLVAALFSPEGGTPLTMLESHAVPLVAIWLTAVFLFIAKRTEEALRASERLMRDAVESLSDGFALYDSEDRLVLFNTRYREGLSQISHILKAGVRFEDVIRAEAERGLLPDSKGRVEDCVRDRRDLHRKLGAVAEQPFGNDRWVQINRYRTTNGGTVIIRTDITERKRVEESLRKLSRAVEQSPAMTIITDLSGKIEYVNSRFTEVTGYALAEVVGKTPRILKSGEKSPEEYEKLWETIAAGKVWRGELHNRKKNGQLYWATTSILPITDQDGDVTNFLAISEDITERKRAEEALREAERRFRNLVDSSVQGILIHQDRRPVYVNQAWAEIHGYTVNEVLAMESVVPLIAASEHARMAEYRKLRMEGGEAPSRYEYEAVTKNGPHIWLENMVTVVTWKDERAIQSAIIDITARKQAEEKLRESEERLRLSLAAARVGTFCWDIEEDMNFWDARMHEIWGLEPGTYTSTATKDFLANVHPEDAERVNQAIARTLDDDAEHNIEYRIVRPDQSVAYVQELAAVVRDDQKRPLKLIGVCLDITGRKRAEEEKTALELEVQEAGRTEAIGLLAGGIAHEINTPIQYIRDNLRFLDDAWGDIGTVVKKYRKLARAARDKGVLETEVRAADSAADEADLEYLLDEFSKATRQSIEGTGRIADIVLAMKEFSHPSMKEKVAADINHAIKSTLTVSRNEWKHVAEVDLDLDETLPPIICLAGEVNQVFLNLIINAVHAIVAKGGDGKERITVSTRQDGDWVEIRVADTGTGIPENVRDKIFNPFFTTKEVGKGTGQGLAICRDVVVNKHGGKIFFETEMGKGTTFVVRLPLNAQENASEAA